MAQPFDWVSARGFTKGGVRLFALRTLRLSSALNLAIVENAGSRSRGGHLGFVRRLSI